MQNHDAVLKQLKEHEAKIQSYQKQIAKKNEIKEDDSYKYAAYKVRNPFRGI